MASPMVSERRIGGPLNLIELLQLQLLQLLQKG